MFHGESTEDGWRYSPGTMPLHCASIYLLHPALTTVGDTDQPPRSLILQEPLVSTAVGLGEPAAGGQGMQAGAAASRLLPSREEAACCSAGPCCSQSVQIKA